jgi:protein phosphatase
MIKMDIMAASRVGCVRHQNEDMILVGHHFLRNDYFKTQVELTNQERYLIAVADGMGGHNRGDVASNDVMRNLHFYFNDLPTGLGPSEFNETIVEWLDAINNYVASKGRADEQFKGMGTTLVGLAFYEGQFYSMNCGDSRLYRYRGGVLEQLTTDHSLSNMLGSAKHSSVITNCIGGGCTSSYIDMVQMTGDILTDDIYMLCSDGLTDMIPDEQIASMLASGADVNSLCDAANEAGGYDNISCCIIKL